MQRTMSRKELAVMYGVSYKTFMKWVGRIPSLNLSKERRLLTPKQVEMIMNILGKPE